MTDMVKYTDTAVVFAEIPGEITLAINISNCPFKCRGCHSPQLRKDIGVELTPQTLDVILGQNKGISCVCFMGGDRYPETINKLAEHVRNAHNDLLVGWYSGRSYLTIFTELKNFDYIKLGQYKKKLGGLSSPTTNQRMYKVRNGYLINITKDFQK